MFATIASVLSAQLLLESYGLLRWTPVFEGFQGGSSFSNEPVDGTHRDQLGKARRALKASRSGVWAIVLTAVYILVPGSSIFRNAFAEIILSMMANEESKFQYLLRSTGALTTSFVTVGLSICFGIKIGFLILTAFENLIYLVKSRCIKQKIEEREL